MATRTKRSQETSPRDAGKKQAVQLAVTPPVEPMLAKLATELPVGDEFAYEPKWDGFRAIVFRSDDVYIQSRDLRPLDRYFPELDAAFLEQLPSGAVVD